MKERHTPMGQRLLRSLEFNLLDATTMTNRRYQAAILSAVTMLGTAGCRVGPRYSVPPAIAQAPPVAYKEAPTGNDDWKIAQPQDAMLRGKWWEIYHDPDLNALEDKLNIDNQTIKVYFADFMEARTLIAQARSQYYPTVSVGPSISHGQSSSNLGSGTVGATGGTGGSTNTTFELPATVSWAPDLWGKVRNEVRNAQYNAQVSAADLENEKLTEEASLAEYYFQLRGQDALLDLYKQTVAADQKSLDLVQASYDAGIGTYISVVEAKNVLQNAQAAYTNLGILRAQYEHAIAMLTGQSASTFAIDAKAVDVTVPLIPVGLPSQLLERRPDIAAAERTMAAANAEIGVAYAAYYPTVTLSTTGGFESSAFTKLLDWSSRFWSVGPSVSETVFDAGLRRAEIRQYESIYNADVASYRQAVLAAVQNVEDELAAERILTTQLGQQEAAEQSAQEYVKLEQGRYDTGVDPYVDVMTAQLTLLTDQQALVTLRTNRMTASVSLIEALGGGWDVSQLPTPAVVSKKIGKNEIKKTN
ncbi:efflux transporter outer membrane subunit [Granulicella sp. 5B5]|uniref:efflux transporter outer membrane subunit n=1 Tax=Granulicella sp. 5B5 TaxID=1617967 RepID=UPI0031FE32E1